MSTPGPLRHVDPDTAHGALYRGYARLVGTPAMGWVSRHTAWKLDPWLLRVTGGRVGFGLMLPTALLETTGARTGQPRHNSVIYFHDGDDVILVPSKIGMPEHPAWYHNARAHPAVRLGGQAFRAEVVEDEPTRTRLWALADRVFPPYASYRRRAAASGRIIPLLRLVAL
jgi:deazaflavin-dependent oxidoreductase (nitroreductase family)